MKAVVIGGGLAGLSAALALLEARKKGRFLELEVTVFERDSMVGGLAKTVELSDGIKNDLGPHRFHTKKPELQSRVQEIMGGDLGTRTRRSHIYLEKNYFRYPLEGINVAMHLPPWVTAAIFMDFLKASSKKGLQTDDNFKNWVITRFGQKMFDIYFDPYTEKVWGLPTDKISADWADQRIRLLNLKDAIVSTLFKSSQAREKLVNEFHYPDKGGIGEISDRLAAKVTDLGGEIYVNAEVARINTSEGMARSVMLKGNDAPEPLYGGKSRLPPGEAIPADIVLNTMPIDRLSASLHPLSSTSIQKRAKALRFRSIVYVFVLVDRPGVRKDNWIYYPQRDIIFNRLSEQRNFNQNLVPEGKTVVCAEITCNPGDDIWDAKRQDIGKQVVEDMVKAKVIDSSEKDVIMSQWKDHVWTRREADAYPVYDLNYAKNLKLTIDYLDAYTNLITFGRNGLFKYNNMDHSIEMGLSAGRLLGEALRYHFDNGMTDMKKTMAGVKPDIDNIMDRIMTEKDFLG